MKAKDQSTTSTNNTSKSNPCLTSKQEQEEQKEEDTATVAVEEEEETTKLMAKDLEAASYDHINTPKDNVQEPARPKASVMQLLLISMPRMAINMAWAAQWAALGPYLQTMLPAYAVQLTQVIGPLSGILVAPIIGVMSDRSTNAWGRRRPFILYAAIASAICWTLMGYTSQIGEALGDYGKGRPGEDTHRPWTAMLTVLFYTWMDVTVNIVQVPAFLLIADFAGERQTTGAALGQGWSTLGSILVAGYIYCFGAAHKSLQWFLGMLSVTMIVTVAIACYAAKEIRRQPDAQDLATSKWTKIKEAFKSIFTSLGRLPRALVVYCVIMFCIQYGYTAYNGSKGQFFGIEVYGGTSDGADSCGDMCSVQQERYNHGVEVAGGSTDLIFNIVGYLYSWALPFLVRSIGAKWVLTITSIPQALLMVMAFTKVVTIDVIIVIMTTFTQGTIFAMLVPVIIHVMGTADNVGMYVGALNSANCLGQLLNFVIGAAMVETSLGYKLPIFVGGAMSLLGILIGVFFFKIKMYSM